MKSLSLQLATPVTTLALIGGGEFSFGETREIDQYLLAQMPVGRRTVAFLPTASGSAEYASHFGAYLRGLDPGVEVVNVPIYRGRDARRAKSLAQIAAAGMVYLGGGVTNNLVETLRESPAELAIRDAAAGGAVIAAIGAAASCFGIAGRSMRGVGTIRGLGWLEATAVDTGFSPDNDDALRRLMSIAEVRLGVGIPAQTAIIVRKDGNTEIVGDGNVAAFRKS
jgi:cyanophycinase-like exopeptidase